MAENTPTPERAQSPQQAQAPAKSKARTFRFKNKRGDVIRTQNKGYARQLRQDSNFTELDK